MTRLTFENGHVLGESYAFVPASKGKDRLAYTTAHAPGWKHLTGFWHRVTGVPGAAHVEFLRITKTKHATHLFVVWCGSGAPPESLQSESEYRLTVGSNNGATDLTVLFYPIQRTIRVFDLLHSWDSPSLVAAGFARVDFRWIGGFGDA